MTRLTRTSLSSSDKVELATASVAWQENYGATTALGRIFGVSRPTVYETRATTEEVLTRHFEGNITDGTHVLVDDAQLKRAIVALRIMSPSAIRPIEDVLPILYPRIHIPSYGGIHKILMEAEESAGIFNEQAALDRIHSGAVDEMFSQGDPVLAGVDLDTGYLFLLSLEESRSGDDWEKVLKKCQSQGLKLEVVVKDAARGIADGVNRVFPHAEQRDDCFHAHYNMGKLRIRLERRAYGTIQQEFEAREKLDDRKARCRTPMRVLRKNHREACRQCQDAMERHDRFEQAMREVQDAMEFVDLQTGRIRTAHEMQTAIECSARKILAIDDKQCVKVGTYIFNRAPGLALYMDALHRQFTKLINRHGNTATQLAAIIWRLVDDIRKGRRPWSSSRDQKQLAGAYYQLMQVAGQKADVIFNEVDGILEKRHRASSAIEGFNAALRPHLYVHKSASQGFLDLFQAYFNLRKRRWGPNKGNSAYECLTGKPVDDWLSLLGFPLSGTVH